MSDSPTARSESEAASRSVSRAVGGFFRTLRRSFLLSGAFAGLLLIVLAVIVPNGVLKAFLYIWGASAVLGCLGIYGLLSLHRRLR